MRQKKKIKPKIKTNKLNHNPLFIKFLNWKGDRYFVENMLEGILDSFDYDKDKKIVEDKLKNLDDVFLDDLAIFHRRFSAYISSSINMGTVSEEFLLWLNNSFKYIDENKENYLNDETRWVSIKDPEGRWPQSLICYNFIMTFNYFGVDIIKRCPICGSFFCHKGRYAKYCSEGCKAKGMEKN